MLSSSCAKRFDPWKGLAVDEHGRLHYAVALVRRLFGRFVALRSGMKQKVQTEPGVDWIARIDHAEPDFSRRAISYFVGVGAERRDFSFQDRERLAERYGREFGRPTLLISEVASGGTEAGFTDGVRAWLAKHDLPFEEHRAASDTLNRALLTRAQAKADMILDDSEREAAPRKETPFGSSPSSRRQ